MTAVTTMAPKPSSSSTRPRMRPTNRPMTLGCTDPPWGCSDDSGRPAAVPPAAPPPGGAGGHAGAADEHHGGAPVGARFAAGRAGEAPVGLERLLEGALVPAPVGMGGEDAAAPRRPDVLGRGAPADPQDLVGVHGPGGGTTGPLVPGSGTGVGGSSDGGGSSATGSVGSSSPGTSRSSMTTSMARPPTRGAAAERTASPTSGRTAGQRATTWTSTVPSATRTPRTRRPGR